jgi:hypothetical protein
MTSADAVYRALGVFYSKAAGDAVLVEIPFTAETMPNPATDLLARIVPCTTR